MAASCFLGVISTPNIRRIHGFRCSSSAHDKRDSTPRLLKVAVSGVTELLRVLSSGKDQRSDIITSAEEDRPLVCGIEDIVVILQSDYENAYFLTGNFTSSIYAEDCSFEDPTIKFRGRDLYARNLKLLVPFFDRPSLILQHIEKVVGYETNFIIATWKLRTYLKLPWKPLISIDGSTIYDLDDDLKIVRHAESWNISALEAVGQLFIPSIGRYGD